jgi:hypothetical protein
MRVKNPLEIFKKGVDFNKYTRENEKKHDFRA